ncbi:MAG TPA: hypothetical protein VF427_09605 [Noviherbaspirillum sp.]
MRKHLYTIGLFAAAIACYGAGAEGGATVFLLLGGFSELAAWHRLYHPKRSLD